MYTWLLLLLVLICLHGVFVSLYWRARKYLKDLPSYSQIPFLGSMHWFLGGGEKTGLGVDYTSDSEITKNYHEAFTTALELMIKRGTNLLLHFDCLYRLTADHRKFLRALAVMHRLSDRVIKEKQLHRDLIKRNSDTNKVLTENSNPSGFKTVLDMLLDMSESDHMSESQLRSEVNTIIVGGQDTVAATLYYTLLMLGSNADVQERLYAEVKQVFRNKGTIDREAVSSLVYCDAVISETLRLYPPIPAVTRYADHDLDIRCCKIPKGTFCSLNLWGAGRSVRAWGPDAHQYRPERWLPPNTPSAASYMPFSAGRRACIGKRYAMALLKTVLAHCVKNLIFISEAEKLEFKMDVGLRATTGYLLQVQLRT